MVWHARRPPINVDTEVVALLPFLGSCFAIRLFEVAEKMAAACHPSRVLTAEFGVFREQPELRFDRFDGDAAQR